MIDISIDKTVLGPWICKRIGKIWYPEGKETIGLVDSERILAAVLFEDYAGLSMTCHVALADAHVPLRKLIAAAFRYAFVSLHVERLMGVVNSNNKAALRFDYKLGFEPVATLPRMYADGGDAVIFLMERSKCRWIPVEHRRAA